MSFLQRKTISSGLISSLLGLLVILTACSVRPGALSNSLAGAQTPAPSSRLTPHLTEFPLLAGTAPRDIAAGSDGALWFTESNESAIGRITTTGMVTTYSLGTNPNHQPSSITTGFDGALWFTENIGRIGRLSPLGQFTSIGEVSVKGEPGSIAAGPDGTLWFTDTFSPTIEHISRDGQNITTFPIPSTAFSITTGPDGALWFTEVAQNKIGRITQDGQTMEYSAGLPTNVSPAYITQGPDHALWFTASGQGLQMPTFIGRIDPQTFKVKLFPLGTGLYPDMIIAGPYHKLWFTEGHADAIGSIDPTTGQIIEYTIDPATGQVIDKSLRNESYPLDLGLYGLTMDNTGALWFTEINADKIGRISFTVPAFTLSANAVTAKAGQMFSGTMATVAGTISSGGLLVNIEWGDGLKAGKQTLKGGTGTIQIQGNHTYEQAGTYTFTIIVEDLGTKEQAQVSGTVTVG